MFQEQYKTDQTIHSFANVLVGNIVRRRRFPLLKQKAPPPMDVIAKGFQVFRGGAWCFFQ
jgi:hypothetical protein